MDINYFKNGTAYVTAKSNIKFQKSSDDKFTLDKKDKKLL